LNLIDDGEERCLVEKVRPIELDSLSEVLDATPSVRTGAAGDADDPVVQIEEVLGKVAAVLSRNPGDERRSQLHASVLFPTDVVPR
jgi:hypothetical protein